MKLRTFAIACLAVLALQACSSPGGAKPNGSKNSSSSQAQSSDRTTNPVGPNAEPTETLTPYSVGIVGPCTPKRSYSARTGHPGINYIESAPSFQQDWGPGCDRLDAGEKCKVLFNASYTVTTGEHAYIEFQGWTKTGKKPFVAKTIGPTDPVGQFEKWPFDVVVPKAASVAFRLVLLNDEKIPVAIGDSYVYPVGCHPKPPK